jgi:hypothetical protein
MKQQRTLPTTQDRTIEYWITELAQAWENYSLYSKFMGEGLEPVYNQQRAYDSFERIRKAINRLESITTKTKKL